MAQIHELMPEVLKDVNNVPKNGTNSFHKYKYVMEADMTEAVKKSMTKHGLFMTVAYKHVETREVQRKQGPSTLTVVELEAAIYAPDGSCVTGGGVGTGEDRGDKGAYKAMTGALKYFLYKTFMVATHDDPELEDERPEPEGNDGFSVAAAKSLKRMLSDTRSKEIQTKGGTPLYDWLELCRKKGSLTDDLIFKAYDGYMEGLKSFRK